MFKRFSVFIPVYKESNLVDSLLHSLLADPYKEKEIFVVVDEPTAKSLELANKFAKQVFFVWNGVRKGKANVLNEIVMESKGEILLFLDSDVVMNGAKGFLGAISEAMKDAELVEVKKEIIRDSFIARITSYDYLSFNITNWFFSHKLRKCLGLNGAAFAMKREAFMALGGFRRVIVEDLDIATRSFIKGVRYKFLMDISVSVRAPSSWSTWFKQRKRWGIGGALWFKEYLRDLLSITRHHPNVLIPSLIFIFPCLPFFLGTLLMPEELHIKALYLSLVLLSTQTSLLLPPTVFTSTSLAIFRNLVLMVVGLGTYSLLFYLLARKMSSSFNPLEFTIFYLIYSPLWFLTIVASLTKVYFKSGQLNVDWQT